MSVWWCFILILGLVSASKLEYSAQQKLSLAVKRGKVEKVLQLLGHEDVNINWIPNGFDSSIGLKPALFEAIWAGNYEITKILLDRGADPNISFHGKGRWINFRPLSLAYSNGAVDLIILLCEYDVDLDFEWSYTVSGGATLASFTNSIWNAGKSYKPEVLHALLEHELRSVISGKKQINSRSQIDNYSIFDRIVIFGTPEQIERAVKLGADPNAFYYWHKLTVSGYKIEVVHPPAVALCRYSLNFTPEKLDALIKCGGNIDACIAIENLKRRVFERTGRTALWYACKDPDTEIIKHLLRHGADPSITDSSGRTPLILLQKNRAPHMATLSILQILMKRGVNLRKHLEHQCKNKLTALDYSMLKQDHKMIRMLLLLGSPFEFRTGTKISVPMMSLAAIWAGEFQNYIRTALSFIIMKTQRDMDYLPLDLVRLILSIFINSIINTDD